MDFRGIFLLSRSILRRASCNRPSFHFFILLLIPPFFSPAIFQQQPLKLIVQGDTANPISISSYLEGQLTYTSLDELATTLGLKTFWNEETRKLEVTVGKYRLRVAASNPFVVAADVALNTTSIHQLPTPAQLRGKKLYVPIAFFLPFFNSLYEKRITIFSSEPTPAIEPPPSSTPFDITGLSIEPKLNGYLVRINANKRFDEFESWQKPDGWLYVTISDAKADIVKINGMKLTEIFSRVVAIQYPASVQLTFKLTKEIASSEITSDPSSKDILLSLRVPSEAERVAAEKEREELMASLEGARRRWKLDVIVIDAGHGGEDPGAIGIARVQEKDITLNLALKLGKLIEKNLKDVKVVYTRRSDTFVELYRRGQVANAARGKLFISIHCNSMRRKPHQQNGFEIYLLRPGRTEDAIEISERENAVVKLEKGYEQRYQELTEENFILVTMAQSAYVKYSERFAEILQEQMGKQLSLENNGVKQAGFYVLVGASMPNVLVEAAYLSNRKDEKFLKSQKGQQEIAAAIFSAVKKYKAEYEKALEEGKELGSSN